MRPQVSNFLIVMVFAWLLNGLDMQCDHGKKHVELKPMRLLLALVALSLSAPTWSSGPTNSPAPPTPPPQSDARPPAKMVRPVNPDNYYPGNSLRRGEAGTPIVQVCVDKGGKLLRQPVITQSSGYPNLDAAALRVARDTRYAAGVENGSALPESCITFKVKFGLPVEAAIARPVNPDDYYPPDAKRRGESGGPIVKVCVGPDGEPLREPEVTESSGFPDLDAAAIEVAKAVGYRAGKINDITQPESCIRFKVQFGPKAADDR